MYTVGLTLTRQRHYLMCHGALQLLFRMNPMNKQISHVLCAVEINIVSTKCLFKELYTYDINAMAAKST